MERIKTGHKGDTKGCASCFYHRANPVAVSFAAPQMFYHAGAVKKTIPDFPQNFYRQSGTD